MRHLIVFFLFLACFQVLGQSDPSNHIRRSHSLSSQEGYKYQLEVMLPRSYSDSIRYPVLFYLDAWWLEEMVNGTYRVLDLSREVEDVILVGISIKGNEYDFNAQRTRDYTPSPYDVEKLGFPLVIPLVPRPFEVNELNSGKSEAFSQLLSDRVFPFVAANYSVNEQRKAILGHSFGGLFGAYDLAKESPLFNSYVLISPALWWNKNDSFYDGIEQRFQNGRQEVDLFLCFGTREGIPVALWTDRFHEFLSQNDYRLLKYEFIKYEGEDHSSILSRSIYEGMLFLYAR